MSTISEGGAGTKLADITRAVLASYARSPDGRLRAIMEALVRHLHGFIEEVQLTDEEWRKAIGVLTATGHITDEKRQEWILWSDVLGASMLVDALAHPAAGEVTESTVLGPFYVEGSPLRAYGQSLAETDAGQPAWIYGMGLSEGGTRSSRSSDHCCATLSAGNRMTRSVLPGSVKCRGGRCAATSSWRVPPPPASRRIRAAPPRPDGRARAAHLLAVTRHLSLHWPDA